MSLFLLGILPINPATTLKALHGRFLVEDNQDKDNDGVEDGLEVNVLRTNPTIADTDNDGIPDGIEATTSCLNPLVSDSHSMKISSIGINETEVCGNRLR